MRAPILKTTSTVLALCLGAFASQRSVEGQAPASPANTGNAPGGAFILNAEDGFDSERYRISDYEIAAPWIDAGFSPENTTFRDGLLHLSLNARPYKTRQHTGAELRRIGFYGYGRYEVVMRGIAGQGVVSSFFTHTHSQFGDPHEEIDIELLGNNTRRMHLTHFQNGESAGANIDLPFDFTKAEHLYAFEWKHDSIKWFVDGRQVHEARQNIPSASGRVIVNVWTAGKDGWSWIGKPDFKNGAAATYRCISHVPVGQTGPQCSDEFSPPR